MHGPYPYHPSFRLSFTALAEPGTTVQLSADNSACETWLRDGTAPAVTLFQVLSVREDNVPAQATRGGRAHAGQEIKPQLLASGARQTSHLMPHTCAHFAMLSRRFPNFLAGEAASVVYVKFRAPHIGNTNRPGRGFAASPRAIHFCRCAVLRLGKGWRHSTTLQG